MGKIGFNNLNIVFNLKGRRLLKEWLNQVAALHGYEIFLLDYVFTSDEVLLQFNLDLLQHDTYTDIITVDLSDKPDDEFGNDIEGDIYISVERVKENAKIFNVTFRDELLRVMVHGLLHLCGFGDKSEEDKDIMRNQESAAIALFHTLNNVPRGT